MCINAIAKPVADIGKKATEPVLEAVTSPYRPDPTPAPAPQESPKPMPTPEAQTAKAIEAVNQNTGEQVATRRNKAMRSTLLTSPMGLTDPANTRRKTLLGQ